ncbi:MAG: HlyC/CorC family transporter [Anaerolineales bacterium]|nr:HlyC/CorC family transporter [Anaerolineales bacterium]
MSQIAFEVGIVLVLILINGLFAMSEIAIVSARRARLEQFKDEGVRGASTALALANNPNRFLSTVQVGITLVGIFAGAYGGATLAQKLEVVLVPIFGEQLGSGLSFFLVVGTITYLSVVIGELVPKRLALQYGERLSVLIAGPMSLLSTLATPIVYLLSTSTDVIVRLLGIHEPPDTAVSEEEIRVLLRQSSQAGFIEEIEREMVESIFRLDDWTVESMMTPRPEIVWLDINHSQEEIRETLRQSPHARLPVCDGDLDHVIGVVSAKDLLARNLDQDEIDLRTVMLEPLFVPESVHAHKALERMRKTGIHMALLIDEYGGVEGLVTLFDILEAIVGDIPTADEIEMPRVVQRTDGSWLVDGLLGIYDFKQKFDLDELPREDNYQTVGGFMISQLGRVPQAGDLFIWAGLRFEVADMDGKRVDKVLVTAVDVSDEG